MLADNAILFLVAIPVVQQLIKLYRDRSGRTIGKLGNQLITLVLAGGALALTGGFVGIALPMWPVIVAGDDLLTSVSAVLEFGAAGVAYLGIVWAVISALYETVWDRLFTAVSARTPLTLVTRDKLAVG